MERFPTQKQVIDALYTHYDEVSDEDKKEQLAALMQSHESLNNLLNNVLEWSSLESGRLIYKPIRIDLATVVRNSLRSVTPYARNKNIDFKLSIPDDCVVMTDVNFVETILRNLLSNAIKFSNPGSSIDISGQDENTGIVRLSITDHGTGMTKEQLQSLFTKSASTLGTAGEKGSGMGLMVCKKLSEKGRERITVESEKGKGSTFSILIPRTE